MTHNPTSQITGRLELRYSIPVYYVASGGNFLPTFRDNLSVPSSRVNEDGTDRFTETWVKKIPLLAA